MGTTEIGFEVKPLPAFLRVPTKLSRKLGIDAPKLTPESLTKAAARDAGLPAKFPAHVEEAMEVLCRSYVDDAGLHWFGRMNQWNLAVTGLSTFLRVEQAFADDPTLADTPLIPPLVVTGLPRSGTTFLHRLLSAVEDAHPLTLGEHIHPLWRGPEVARRADVEARFFSWRMASQAYGMDAIHLVRPELPDECNFGMRPTLRSMIYWATASTHGYLRWLLAQDLRESYLFYRKLLILHQRRNPGKRLTLKCPHHLAWLPALTEALPEALIVQTHRDPVRAVASECKLVLSLQALSTDQIDWRRTVESNVGKVTTFARRAVAFDDQDDQGRILHLDYRRVVSNPVELARDIRQHFGLPFTPEQAAHTEAFFADNRQHKHGKHSYSNEQFGLEVGQIEADFADYRQRFILDGVPASRPWRPAVSPEADGQRG